MNREERVLNTIYKKPIDYLPSQIYFASLSTKEKLKNALNFVTIKELENYLDNHLYISALRDDIFRYRDNSDLLNAAIKLGFAKIDENQSIVFDRWGIGYHLFSDGYCIQHSPLFTNDLIESFIPPEPLIDDNFSLAELDLMNYSGESLVLCSGYIGILEKAWALTGFENFMTQIALNPIIIEGLLDKVTEYKIKVAHKLVDLGFKCAHTGDDFGTQKGLIMSKDMWRKYIKPRLAAEWQVFKNAGLPIIHHSCGNVVDIIGDMIDIGLDVLEPVQPVMDLTYLKREFGQYITFWGGIDTQELLPYASPDEVKEIASRAIEILGHGGGMIIAPSQEIMADVPIKNVVALVETIIQKRAQVI